VVRTDHGAEAAAALARRLVVPARRTGGQAQYIDRSLPEEIGNDPLAEVVTWALDNLSKQFDVEALAARAYMSRRTFDRRFRTLTGSAPLQWLISQRVLQAQRLLETTDASVDEVARRCGFRSPVALRGHFRRQLGMSPAVYRTTFRSRRPQVPGPGGNPGPGAGLPAQTAGTGAGAADDGFGLPGSGLPGAFPLQQGSPDGRGEPGRLARPQARTRQGGRPDPADHAATEDSRTDGGARGRREGPAEPRVGLPARGHPDAAWAAVQRRVSD